MSVVENMLTTKKNLVFSNAWDVKFKVGVTILQGFSKHGDGYDFLPSLEKGHQSVLWQQSKRTTDNMQCMIHVTV